MFICLSNSTLHLADICISIDNKSTFDSGNAKLISIYCNCINALANIDDALHCCGLCSLIIKRIVVNSQSGILRYKSFKIAASSVGKHGVINNDIIDHSHIFATYKHKIGMYVVNKIYLNL